MYSGRRRGLEELRVVLPTRVEGIELWLGDEGRLADGDLFMLVEKVGIRLKRRIGR